MTLARRRRPIMPSAELGRSLALPKPQFQEDGEPADTRNLALRKIHPSRNKPFMKWLTTQRCSIAGKLGHRCWGRVDPAHTSKLGTLKGPDDGCFSLCRLAHDEQELGMDAFDLKYGINRFEIAFNLLEAWHKRMVS